MPNSKEREAALCDTTLEAAAKAVHAGGGRSNLKDEGEMLIQRLRTKAPLFFALTPAVAFRHCHLKIRGFVVDVGPCLANESLPECDCLIRSHARRHS